MVKSDIVAPDLSDLTCTNLMIRLKTLLKKKTDGSAVECIIGRDQKDTIEEPFRNNGYSVQITEVGTNRYHLILSKNIRSEER